MKKYIDANLHFLFIIFCQLFLGVTITNEGVLPGLMNTVATWMKKSSSSPTCCSRSFAWIGVCKQSNSNRWFRGPTTTSGATVLWFWVISNQMRALNQPQISQRTGWGNFCCRNGRLFVLTKTSPSSQSGINQWGKHGDIYIYIYMIHTLYIVLYIQQKYHHMSINDLKKKHVVLFWRKKDDIKLFKQAAKNKNAQDP